MEIDVKNIEPKCYDCGEVIKDLENTVAIEGKLYHSNCVSYCNSCCENIPHDEMSDADIGGDRICKFCLDEFNQYYDE